MTPARVVVATPSSDMVAAHYHAAAWNMMGHEQLIVDPRLLVDADLVRARSRCVRLFLQRSEGTHLLFWDADVVGDLGVLVRMVAEGVDCIGATYPKKRLDADGVPRSFAHSTQGVAVPFVGERAEVAAVGCGFMLLSRSLLARMWVAYADELSDYAEGTQQVMMFALQWGAGAESSAAAGRRVLWPEDYSFCARVRAMGEAVHLYTGPGSPLAHVGHHVFVGRAEDAHPTSEAPSIAEGAPAGHAGADGAAGSPPAP